MGNQIGAGQQCVVSRDVVVEGQYAFKKGERLVVEKISPNPERPQYKYVVFSSRLQKRFQLSDKDITLVPGTSPSDREKAPAPKLEYGKSQKSAKIATIIAVAVLLIGVTIVRAVVLTKNNGGNGNAILGVPSYPGAVHQETTEEIMEGPVEMQSAVLETDDSQSQVSGWYRKELSGKPEFVDCREEGGYTYRSGDKYAMVTIVPGDEKNTAIIISIWEGVSFVE